MGSDSVRNVVEWRYSPLPLHSRKNTFCSLCEKCQKLVVILLLKLSNVLRQIAFKVPQRFKGSPSPQIPTAAFRNNVQPLPFSREGSRNPSDPSEQRLLFCPSAFSRRDFWKNLKCNKLWNDFSNEVVATVKHLASFHINLESYCHYVSIITKLSFNQLFGSCNSCRIEPVKNVSFPTPQNWT